MKRDLVLIVLLLVALATTKAGMSGLNGKEISGSAQKEIAVVETSMGTFEILLYRADAPKTVENFVRLSQKGYYNGIIFHRVAKGFVIQTGDPTGTGSGGRSIWGKEFEDELNPNTPSYKEGYVKGVVAMANRGPNTNTSQFFILLNDAPRLPHNYTIFGKVVKGMDVVERIGQVPITPQLGPNDGRPLKNIVIKKITIRIIK